MSRFTNPLYLALMLAVVSIPFVVDYAFAKDGTIVWQGTVAVRKTYTVPKGKTLEIRPGTKVLFSKGATLSVKGTLKASGRKGEEILFTSAKKGAKGAWHEIMLDNAGNSVMEHCTIENAAWGLHSHDTKLNLSNSTIRNSEVGLRFRSGPLTICNCRFTTNRIGLRSYQGVAQITDSDFTDNEIGIFVREKGSGLSITRSNFHGNSGFNIRIGDFNDEDVTAMDNWWGTEGPLKTIFDARNEPGIGQVLYEPFRREQVQHTTDP